jgi:hypothetical protein
MTAKDKLLREFQRRAYVSPRQLKLLQSYMDWVYAVGYDDGLADRTKIKRPTCNREVYQLKDGEIVNKFNTMTEASQAIDVDIRRMSYAIKRKHTIKGYDFEKAEIILKVAI